MKKFLLSIFAVMLAVFSVQAEEVTFTATATGTAGTSGTGSEVVLSNSSVNVVLSKAYCNGTQFRIYSGCSLTVTGTNVTITGVEFTATDGRTGAITLKSGGGNITSSGNVRSWAGSSNEIVLSADAQIRTQSITVTYIAIGESETPIPTFDPVSGTTFGESLDVTIAAEDGTTIYYTTNGDTPTTECKVYSEPFTITETTTVKAIAVKDEMESSVAVATYTKLINLDGCSVADAIEAYGNGQTGNATIVGYIVGAAPSGSLAKAEFTSETAVASNILIADDPNETDVAKCMPIKLASGTTVRNVLNLSENKGVYKKKVAIECVLGTYFSVAGTQNVSAAGIYWNVSEAGYATLYLGYKVLIPETVEAYIVTEVNADCVILSQVSGIIPAEVGLILKGEGEHLFNITSSAATVDVDVNLLAGTLVDTEIAKVEGNSYYILANGEEGIGFYNPVLGEDITKFNNAANKAYLVVEGAEGVAYYSFRFPGTTGIEEITDNREQSTVIYDLTGRRVEAITAPGIYIVGGKKVLVK